MRERFRDRVVATSSSTSSPARLIGIQSLRGFAVLLVIMVHLHHTELKYSHGPQVLGAWNSIGIAGVDIFLVVSGFVLTYLAFGHFGQRHYAAAYAYARVSRVYPVYMLLTALMLPLYLSVPALFNAAEGHEVNLLRSLLLIPDVRLPLIPVAWTLHHELYFYLVLGAMLMLPERHLPKAILAWLLVTTALIAYGLQTPRPLQGAFERVLFNPINLEFILGMMVAWAVVHGPQRGATACICIAFAGLAIGYAIWFRLTGEYWVGDFWRVWVFGLPAALFIYGIVMREQQQGQVLLPGLAWIGDAAYSIYLTHLMVLVVLGRLWGEFGPAGWPAHLIFLAGSVAVALGVGWCSFTYAEQPMLKWCRRIDPTRVRPSAKPLVS